ncbi:hypothetical protein SNE40_011581 [Patella caerulea]|uniref:Uncharacterized protein n=1 Tax=Patella caerulea TaxID=87958 RepID=A0AAN8JJH1_PATCE
MSFNVLISWQVLCVHLLCLNSALSLESDPIFLEDELPLETIEEVHVADSFHKSDDLHNDYNNFYDYDVIDIDGDNVSLDTYRGMVHKMILIY